MSAAGRRRTHVIVVGAALFLAGPAAGRAGEPYTPETSETRIRMVATLRSVDTQVRAIGLLTGTGFALRLVRAEVAESCRITTAGETAGLVDLKVGGIVRVECLETGGRLVAVVIETVGQAPAEHAP